VPVNAMKATTSCLSGVINWKGVRVGLLDSEKLFQGLEGTLL
jgi:chemotaxis signal transduction protein